MNAMFRGEQPVDIVNFFNACACCKGQGICLDDCALNAALAENAKLRQYITLLKDEMAYAAIILAHDSQS